jgi:hypothetical protein
MIQAHKSQILIHALLLHDGARAVLVHTAAIAVLGAAAGSLWLHDGDDGGGLGRLHFERLFMAISSH